MIKGGGERAKRTVSLGLESRGSLDPELGDYFGSLAETMLALFQAVTDGQEWREMLKPLMTEISPWMAVPFCMYISFTVFALLTLGLNKYCIRATSA